MVAGQMRSIVSSSRGWGSTSATGEWLRAILALELAHRSVVTLRSISCASRRSRWALTTMVAKLALIYLVMVPLIRKCISSSSSSQISIHQDHIAAIARWPVLPRSFRRALQHLLALICPKMRSLPSRSKIMAVRWTPAFSAAVITWVKPPTRQDLSNLFNSQKDQILIRRTTLWSKSVPEQKNINLHFTNRNRFLPSSSTACASKGMTCVPVYSASSAPFLIFALNWTK